MSEIADRVRTSVKIQWILLICIFIFFDLIYHVFKISRLIIDPLFFACASFSCIYFVFLKKNPLPLKTRLIDAMFAGAFVWMFIESLSKLFAKWAVWKFF